MVIIMAIIKVKKEVEINEKYNNKKAATNGGFFII